MSAKGISWLHISDIHVGMGMLSWLWPTLKDSFLDDLSIVIEQSGPPDLVIFSGDLVQSGAAREFDQAKAVLSQIWERLRSLGSVAPLLIVPGNHDLRRPDALDPEALVFRQWWHADAVREAFWEDKGKRYQDAISSYFSDYEKALLEFTSVLPCVKVQRGLIPGDFSYVHNANGLSVGIVGLNSSWLHQSDEAEGLLHVDTRQLLAVTEMDPGRWCTDHDANLLITHHPASWLHESSRALWKSEIFVPGRFDAHLFGHMHASASSTWAEGGSAPRRSIQAASLFGLEKLSSGVERQHGYWIGSIGETEGIREIRLWPRKAREVASGAIKLGPDVLFDLDAQNSISERLNSPRPISTTRQSEERLKFPTSELASTLRKIKRDLGHLVGHRFVRVPEQTLAATALQEAHGLWLIADWGMGSDGFLKALQSRLGHVDCNAYQLDAHSYASRNEFLQSVSEQVGVSLEQLCQFLAEESNAYLILDDLPIERTTQQFSAVNDIEELARTILQVCPNLRLILRARVRPTTCTFGLVEILPLDGADTRAYLSAEGGAQSVIESPFALSQFHAYTGGVPSQIDDALRELKVIALKELISTAADRELIGHPDDAPIALVRTLSELSTTTNQFLQRAFLLLKALAVFPQGEQLARIRRFNNSAPFFPPHALELAQRGLIDSIEGMHVTQDSGDLVRTLVVRRRVRDLLYQTIGQVEFVQLNREALALYFGDDWQSGRFRPPSYLRFDDVRRTPEEIGNAIVLIVRLMREVVGIGNQREMKAALGLSFYFATALYNARHFRGAVSFFTQVLPAMPVGGFEQEVTALKCKYAESLRMLDEKTDAKQLLLSLRDAPLSKFQRQSVLLDLALCHFDESEYPEAKDVARQVLALIPKGSYADQAEEILAECEPDSPERTKKLLELETKAKREDRWVAYGSLLLRRAERGELTGDAGMKELELLIKKLKSVDHYAYVRASVEWGMLRMREGYEFDNSDRNSFISVYHYLYNQWFSSLFKKCHSILWHIFERAADKEDLLRLFMYSSLVWRVRGDEESEAEYARKLSGLIGNLNSVDVARSSRELVYALSRENVFS